MDELQKSQILEKYCCNEMQLLKQVCYPKISKIGGISQMDYDDLYSIALDALRDSVERFDDSKNCKFSTFLNGNIDRKFATYIRDRNTIKRGGGEEVDENGEKIYRQTISIDAPTEDGIDLCEKVASNFTIEDELSEEMGFSTDDKIKRYLECLSNIQRKIVILLSEGYKSTEIQDKLHISSKRYFDNLKAIQAYENVKVLM